MNGRVPRSIHPARLLAHLGTPALHPGLVRLVPSSSARRNSSHPPGRRSTPLITSLPEAKASPSGPTVTSVHTLELPHELPIQDDNVRSEVFRHSATAYEIAANEGAIFKRNNQNLALQGDAVIRLVLIELVQEKYPKLSIGDQTTVLAVLQSNQTMSQISLALKLPQRLKAAGSKSFTDKSQTRAQGTVFEAYIGGLKADGKGLDALRAHIRAIYEPVLLVQAYAAVMNSRSTMGDPTGHDGSDPEVHGLAVNWNSKVQEYNARKGHHQQRLELGVFSVQQDCCNPLFLTHLPPVAQTAEMCRRDLLTARTSGHPSSLASSRQESAKEHQRKRLIRQHVPWSTAND